MQKCKECGNELEENAKFCSDCGSKTTSTSNQDEPIKADIKVEITNATAEKAFKKVGETILDGKEAVKATTRFGKKLLLPVILLIIVLGIPLGIVGIIYNNKMTKQTNNNFMGMLKAQSERENARLDEIEKARLYEEKLCVINTYKKYDNNEYDSYGLSIYGGGKWEQVKAWCHLSYTELENYKKELGMNLEKL